VEDDRLPSAHLNDFLDISQCDRAFFWIFSVQCGRNRPVCDNQRQAREGGFLFSVPQFLII
jgi:hypothetical protein